MIQSKKEFNSREKIERVWAVEEIKNLVSRYAFLEAGNQREEILEKLWVRVPENQKNASFGRNWGFYSGMDAIREYYVGRNRFGAVGTNLMHPFTTKLIGLADDGETAQGLWMSVSYETAPDAQGELHGYWIAERVAIDFIKEDTGWKIWHLFIGTGLCAHAGENYHALPIKTETKVHGAGNPDWYMVGKEHTEAEVALWDQILDYPEREAFAEPTYPCQAFSSIYNDQMWFPHLPKHYSTFSDVVSFDFAGWKAVAETGQGRVE